MDPQLPPEERGVKSQSSVQAPAVPPPPPVMPRYPKPPALLPRLVLLILKPESWPSAARYPTRFTMIPLAIAIFVAALVIGISYGCRFTQKVEAFSNRFPTMIVNSDGVMKPKAPLADPVRFTFYGVPFIIDPMKTTHAESTHSSDAILITNREFVFPFPNDSGWRVPFSSLDWMGASLPEKGKTAEVTGASIRRAAPRLGVLLGLWLGTVQMVGDVFWSALIVLFLSPLITLSAGIGERSLVLPKRATYRMAAAVVVPLVLFNALLHALGYPIFMALGTWTSIFWFAAAAGLAIWTGVMARRMFGPARRRG